MCAFRIRKLSMLFIIVLLSATFTQAAFASYDFDSTQRSSCCHLRPFLLIRGVDFDLVPTRQNWSGIPYLQVRDGFVSHSWSANFSSGGNTLPYPDERYNFKLECQYDPSDKRLKGKLVIDMYQYLYLYNPEKREHEWTLVHMYTSTCEVVSEPIYPGVEDLVTIYTEEHIKPCQINIHLGEEHKGKYYYPVPLDRFALSDYKVIWVWSSKQPETKTETEETEYEDSGARFSGLSGEVEIWHYDEDREDARVAKLDMVIYVEDHVITGERSSAIISFMDMTTFIMKPETEIIIPSPAAKESLMKLLVGNLLTNVKRMIEGKTLDVEMGQAVSGTKGTIYVAEERNGISRLKVIEGEVEFRSKATGETQIIKAGEQIYADKSGLGPKTTFDIQEELKSWEPYEKMAQQASQAGATQPSSQAGAAQPTGQEVISSANQIIQIALPMIQSYLPLIVIIMLILIFAATIARRSKRK